MLVSHTRKHRASRGQELEGNKSLKKNQRLTNRDRSGKAAAHQLAARERKPVRECDDRQQNIEEHKRMDRGQRSRQNGAGGCKRRGEVGGPAWVVDCPVDEHSQFNISSERFEIITRNAASKPDTQTPALGKGGNSCGNAENGGGEKQSARRTNYV